MNEIYRKNINNVTQNFFLSKIRKNIRKKNVDIFYLKKKVIFEQFFSFYSKSHHSMPTHRSL